MGDVMFKQKQNGKMNKKTKKKFNSLSQEEKEQVIRYMVNDKVSSVFAKELANSMIAGVNTAYEQLWRDYVAEIDGLEVGTVQWEVKVTGLIGFLKDKHIEIERRKVAAEQAKQKQEQEQENV